MFPSALCLTCYFPELHITVAVELERGTRTSVKSHDLEKIPATAEHENDDQGYSSLDPAATGQRADTGLCH